MILRTTTGRSFKGVGAYVLHDKGAQSADRVAFVETVNLASTRAKVALAEMVHTATHQKELKRRAGLRATATSKPVYHYSLSWEVNEKPTHAEQMEAVQESIKALGLDDRQALIVGHTDTKNPHVHVVVNLVCPETGQTAKMGNDRLKLSNWAEDYRRKRGQEHLCPQRKQNNDRRKQGEFVKSDNMSRAEYNAWKKAEGAKIWDEYRADRDSAFASRKGQYDALWQQKTERLSVRKAEVKQLYKPIWRDVFKRQRHELKDFDAGLHKRIKFALSQPKKKVVGLLQAVIAKGDLRRDYVRSQEAERAKIAHEQKARIADASREVTKAWKYDRDQLKAMHKAEDTERLTATREKTEALKQSGANEVQSDFECNKDRRKTDNKAKRGTLDSFFGDNKEAIDKAREGQSERKQRNRTRKRNRPRGGGRKMGR
ncbi:Relaxase/Mobilisation nuclease domain-containing protein [Epibacterium ulvae]|uniref:Relaxase/Mobilisation nuclease domain-containing protein n=1 Tax=Epibacterium ulvae TaxID=1156985 RepID=A0A1G5RJV9_9RHOB|nr:relaxase/mobilization nuclease domain-containing protein [Epibacterium ulvae]SCZ74327.1 Relaxase/Mobilisation nuclease domain-containing protein [Epibacterium ulvae]